jgi:hypothetical protein
MTRDPLPLLLLLAVTAPGLAGAAAPADQVPGEKWRVAASVEAMGMSMPTQTHEVCLPKENPGDALQKHGNGDKTCRTYDVVQSGNRVTGKMDCKDGKSSISGTYEVITEGNHIRTTFNGQTPDGPVAMKNDATKLGTACMVENLRPVQAPPKVAMAATPDACGEMSEQARKDPGRIADLYPQFFGQTGFCKAPKQRAGFCAALNTPAGYLGLKRFGGDVEKQGADVQAMYGHPLPEAVAACGIGSGDAGVAKLRQAMIDAATKTFTDGGADLAGADLLVAEGGDPGYRLLRDVAKKQCGGRRFTSASDPQFQSFCGRYGLALAKDDRAAAQVAAGNAPTAGAGASASAAGPDGSTPAGDETKDGSKKDQLLKKGKSLLEGILGRH